MTIEGTPVGTIAAAAMEYLEREYADEDAELLDVVMVLAVRVERGDGNTIVTHVETGEKSAMPFYVAAGLLHSGLTALGMYEKETDE